MKDSYQYPHPGLREFELGWLTLRDAEQLGASGEGRDTALLLYRAAIRLLVRAALLRSSPASDEADPRGVWARARELPAWVAFVAAQKADAIGWLERVVASEDGDVHLAELSDPERDQALVGMSTLARALAAPLEEGAHGSRRVRRARLLRVIFAALLVLSTIAWFAPRWIGRPNLALHKPVVVPDSDPDFDVDPRQVVDGDELNLGFHTRSDPDASVTIDLGSVESLHRVEVYNRFDCCQDRAVPMTLQLSTDGVNYTTEARRTLTFKRWTATLPANTQARFVRLVHESSEYFHLAEIEVY